MGSAGTGGIWGTGVGSFFEQPDIATAASRPAANRIISDMCWRGRTIGICEFQATVDGSAEENGQHGMAVCFVDAPLADLFGASYGSLQSRMKPQTSHRSLQSRSTSRVPQRSHSHIMDSGIVAISEHAPRSTALDGQNDHTPDSKNSQS